jgi:hypothetical protein
VTTRERCGARRYAMNGSRGSVKDDHFVSRSLIRVTFETHTALRLLEMLRFCTPAELTGDLGWVWA